MEHPYLILTSFFGMIGLEEWAAAYPHVTYMWLCMIVLIFFGWLAGKSITMVPKAAQNVFEVLISGLEEFMVTVTGDEGRKSYPLVLTIFLFVLLGNLMGLVPAFFPPTANINTTLGLAIIAVLWSHVIGVQQHGFKYIKHFLGPVPAMIPLFLPIELIGHSARVLSLTFRLFGNMAGHELVVGILLGLGGMFLAPLPVMALGAFVALVQAFVFFLLSTMYIAGAIEEAH
ncbi:MULTISPECIES: F0F1 ATP synthase subunit A [Desulfobacula]|uniref:ATP synthase subunit a n=2 Tax=Desulfobacula TaxID=28222 RepID=K0NFT7_DESTT|nr:MULTISPECIES: F0F1 ATP synthase subunit A [Desulfobacula]CCK79996.1 AtpB: ATP synthase, subunit A (F-ATPase subunit 6) (ATP synthase F0 sector subunit a) [Desulfobacula toluolica Tol2]SDU17394.1 F-type H+-transporting ATPase subunit a [Desulfobacula phenolica]